MRAETKPVRGVFLRQRQGASRFCASVSERALCEKTEIRVGKLNVQRLVIVFRSLFVRFRAFFCGKEAEARAHHALRSCSILDCNV